MSSCWVNTPPLFSINCRCFMFFVLTYQQLPFPILASQLHKQYCKALIAGLPWLVWGLTQQFGDDDFLVFGEAVEEVFEYVLPCDCGQRVERGRHGTRVTQQQYHLMPYNVQYTGYYRMQNNVFEISKIFGGFSLNKEMGK